MVNMVWSCRVSEAAAMFPYPNELGEEGVGNSQGKMDTADEVSR